MRKIMMFVDGMFMRRRVMAKKWFYYGARDIRNYCLRHLKQNDYLVRIYYYDCLPLNASGISPLSGKEVRFRELESAQMRYKLLDNLKATPNVSLRLGNMEWNGRDWTIVGSKVAPLLKKDIQVDDLSDSDIRPNSESAQIDVKMALDMTLLATKKTADMFVLISDRTDLVPALERVGDEGVQICLDTLQAPVDSSLAAQVDFRNTRVSESAEKKDAEGEQ